MPATLGPGSRGTRSRRTHAPALFSHRQLASPAPSALSLLNEAHHGLAKAVTERDLRQRFADTYLAAVRAAAAVLAARGRPHRGRAKPASVWALLGTAAPELTEWAALFEAHSATRAAVQAGISREVDAGAADELVCQTRRFLTIAERAVRSGG